MQPPLLSYFPSLPLPQLRPAPALTDFDATPCAYLTGQVSRVRAFAAGGLSPEAYQALMDANFRRSGRMVYQPICPACRACAAIRVPVESFRPGKAQRRCWRRNADVKVTVAAPEPTPEKHALYEKYQTQWHAGEHAWDFESFASFLYDSPVDTREFEYRDAGGRLLGVGLCDVCARSVSSVYFYFDPALARRGLGTFSALYEIAFARAHGLPYWYAGYYVGGCASMIYKATFRPCELLGADGQWRPFSERPG